MAPMKCFGQRRANDEEICGSTSQPDVGGLVAAAGGGGRGVAEVRTACFFCVSHQPAAGHFLSTVQLPPPVLRGRLIGSVSNQSFDRLLMISEPDLFLQAAPRAPQGDLPECLQEAAAVRRAPSAERSVLPGRSFHASSREAAGT